MTLIVTSLKHGRHERYSCKQEANQNRSPKAQETWLFFLSFLFSSSFDPHLRLFHPSCCVVLPFNIIFNTIQALNSTFPAIDQRQSLSIVGKLKRYTKHVIFGSIRCQHCASRGLLSTSPQGSKSSCNRETRQKYYLVHTNDGNEDNCRCWTALMTWFAQQDHRGARQATRLWLPSQGLRRTRIHKGLPRCSQQRGKNTSSLGFGNYPFGNKKRFLQESRVLFIGCQTCFALYMKIFSNIKSQGSKGSHVSSSDNVNPKTLHGTLRFLNIFQHVFLWEALLKYSETEVLMPIPSDSLETLSVNVRPFRIGKRLQQKAMLATSHKEHLFK